MLRIQAIVKFHRRELYTRCIVQGYDYENVTTDSRGFKNYWIEIVTDYLFQVLVSRISIDVHKGSSQDYITISRPDSCKEGIIYRFSKTAKISTELVHSNVCVNHGFKPID